MEHLKIVELLSTHNEKFGQHGDQRQHSGTDKGDLRTGSLLYQGEWSVARGGYGGCKGLTGNHFSSAWRQTTTNSEINGSMKQFNALQCQKVNRTV